jgi:hypothetical protein
MLRRSSAHRAVLGAMTGLFLCGTAAAQSPGGPRAGTIEIGAFGQWSVFDQYAGRPNVVPTDGFGYGGRLGVFFTPRLQVEADGYFSPQDRDPDETFCCTGAQPTSVDVSALALRLNYNLPLASAMQMVVGLGAVRTNYAFRGGTGPEADSASFGVSGLAGVRLAVAGPLAVRVDGVADYMPSHTPEANLNLHARAGLSLLLGVARPAPVMAPPPPPPAAVPPPPPPPTVVATTINVCVVENGMLRNVQAQYTSTTGDTTVAGQAFRTAYPSTTPPYAAGATWFIANEPVTFQNRRFVKFGLPRILGVTEVARAGEVNGVPVFAETGMTTRPDVIYIPVRPGCEFQPYQTETKSGAVRGE